MRAALWPDYEGRWHAEEVEKYFAGLLHMPLEVLMAFDEEGRAIGFVELSIRAYAEGCMTDRVAFLEGWYVEPEARRCGVGRALVEAAERWAAGQGCTELGSDAVIDNVDSAAAHAALGFDEVERIRCFRKTVARVRVDDVAGGIDIEEAPSDEIPKLREEIRRGLMAFNVAHAGPDRHQEIVLTARDGSGRLIGGLYGNTAWRWLFVDLLWVDEPHRRQGIGRRLLRSAEAAARTRGCTRAYLDTISFQARPFYEREGYVVFGEQDDYPPGHRRFYLAKALSVGAPATSARMQP